jgi:hypothetical protein
MTEHRTPQDYNSGCGRPPRRTHSMVELGLTHLVNRAAMGDRLACGNLIMITEYL